MLFRVVLFFRKNWRIQEVNLERYFIIKLASFSKKLRVRDAREKGVVEEFQKNQNESSFVFNYYKQSSLQCKYCKWLVMILLKEENYTEAAST